MAMSAGSAEADDEADADPGVGLDHGEELELFHLWFPFSDCVQ